MLEPGVAAFCYIHGVHTLEVMQGLWADKINSLQFTARHAIHKRSFFLSTGFFRAEEKWMNLKKIPTVFIILKSKCNKETPPLTLLVSNSTSVSVIVAE